MGKGDLKTFRGKLFNGSFGKYRSKKKKKLKKNNRKVSVIICDTNIFYGMGEGLIDVSKLGTNLKIGVSQVNLQEFTTSFTLLCNEDLVRKAVQSSFKFHKLERFDPPLIYLRKLSDKSFQYDTRKEQSQFLEFTSRLARGYSIDDAKRAEFEAVCKQRLENLSAAANFFNTEAAKIKPKIKDMKKHRQEETSGLNRNLIDLFVKSITKDDGLSKDFNWHKIELFENTFREFLFELETGAKKIKPNDWNDLFQLIYVQPGEKYWTRDEYWNNLIKKAGMKIYLFEQPKL